MRSRNRAVLAGAILLLCAAVAVAQQPPPPPPNQPKASEVKPPAATPAPAPRPFRPSEDVSSGRKVSFPNDI